MAERPQSAAGFCEKSSYLEHGFNIPLLRRELDVETPETIPPKPGSRESDRCCDSSNPLLVGSGHVVHDIKQNGVLPPQNQDGEGEVCG